MKLPILMVLVATLVLTDCRNIKKERVLEEARPHIEYVYKLNGLIEKYGVRDDSTMKAPQGMEDPNFMNILPLLLRDAEHFDEVSINDRPRAFLISGEIDSILWLNCGKVVNHDGGLSHFDLTDLDIYVGGFSNIAFHGKGSYEGDLNLSDYYLSESDYRNFIENNPKSHIEHALDQMKRKHEEYKYLAIISNLYKVEPTTVGDDNFMPGYIASKVSVYNIENEELYKEFMVYATNSNTVYSGTNKVKMNGREYNMKFGGVKEDLNSNFKKELFFQLIDNGLYKPIDL